MNFDKNERHLAHANGHVTEVVRDNVGHAGGQQESRRGTCAVPVPPSSVRAARGEGGRGQDALMGADVLGMLDNLMNLNENVLRYTIRISVVKLERLRHCLKNTLI